MNLLSRVLPPQTLWTDSLFRAQARAVHWGGSWWRMRDRTVAWFSQSLVTVVGIWLGLAALLWLLPVERDAQTWLRDFTRIYWLLCMAFGLTFDIAIDFNSLSAALGVINGAVNAGRYDLIRLSLMRPAQFVAKQYAVAQVRGWFATARVVWLRLAFVIFGVFALALEIITPNTGASSTFFAYPYMMVGIGAIIYVLEPYWRMKAVTALGVALSARMLNGVSTTLAAGFALLAFWLAQGIFIVALAFVLSFSLVLVFADEFALIVCFPFLVAVAGGTIYGFYSFVQTASLRHAAWRLLLMHD
ncbi:MAG: hypothetical protein IAE80_17420 [Anaerolinea sp.]|nr:hypothetical protein [Anaerolinea sp.]